MCEEESEDTEAVAKLFEINDSIHRTLERYKLMKKGDFDAASKIPKGTLGTSTGVSNKSNDNNELSLIDLDVNPEPSAVNGAAATATRTEGGDTTSRKANDKRMESSEDDLMGLSFQSTTYGQGGGIALGLASNPSKSHNTMDKQFY